jgi:hypothetical protein
MKTWLVHSKNGNVAGFEIPNTFISRSGVVRALKRVPGVHITKYPKAWAWVDDDFVHFTIAGQRFLVVEPFGDNSRYLFITDPPMQSPAIETVRSVFAARGLFASG